MGEPDVKGLLRRTPARLFRQWMIYGAVEPFGVLRADYQAARIACEIANTGYDIKKRGKPFTVEDFLLKFEAPKGHFVRTQTLAEQRILIHMMAHMLAGAPREEPSNG